jgi:hypothetical protein
MKGERGEDLGRQAIRVSEMSLGVNVIGSRVPWFLHLVEDVPDRRALKASNAKLRFT